MKEKTAMMKLIDLVNKDIKESEINGYKSEEYLDALHGVIFDAESLLEDEQEQIWDAHLAGENHECDMEEGEIRDSRECGHYKYYQDTYPTDWKKDEE